ncbi:hypothetical protein [Yoonia sp.]|jgi:hypothetical protein|uniref:hypothetical protein n=1 Tax=Yoonia sp. TaxID=2212373 RepID=UPI00239B2FD7|nr:hypothetical protein [Yoonia sp.]MDE0850201.1 hypothetical protein [Yoonia sp.]
MRGSQSQLPLYLARASYRQRRLRDIIRILPLAGFLAWILPVMSGQVPATSAVGLYIFAGWIVLIVASAWVTSRLTPEAESQSATNDDVTLR